ncbi:MAG TPA: hypothetical protein VGB67_04460, partial [Fibrella sp.]
DYTFNINPHRLEIISTELVCNTRPITSGSWIKNNDTIELNYSLGGNPYQNELILSMDGNLLTGFNPGIFIVSNSSSGGFISNVASDVESIYLRQP